MTSAGSLFTWVPDEEFAAAAGLRVAASQVPAAGSEARVDEELAAQLFG